jgi:tetratricopeptide (TPR) repeat protein
LELTNKLSGRVADIVSYRADRCLELAGNIDEAFSRYEKLLERYPALAADMESVYSRKYGFDSFLEKMKSLMEMEKKSGAARCVMNEYTRNLDMPLKYYSVSFEKEGDNKRASKFWNMLLEESGSPDMKKQAKRHLVRIKKRAKM